MSSETREEVLKLMRDKDGLELQIRELTSILTQNGVGMNDPLVDADGFPLNNVDIYQVRHARHQIICLQNDHKALMRQIEAGLQNYYSPMNGQIDSVNGHTEVESNSQERTQIVTHQIPFARVTEVRPTSPAEFCGLEANDLLVEFGSVNSTNFRNITDISTIVQHSEGQHLNLKVKRGNRFVTLSLLPKKWNGRGLLGCHIVPI